MNERIKKLLEVLQMSPSEIATKLSVQRSTFSHLLSGRNKPSYDFMISLLTVFPNVNPDYLLLGKLPILRTDASPSSETPPLSTSVNIEKSLFELEEKNIDPKEVPNTIEDVVEHSIETNTKPMERKVESIVHFYSDGSFKVYTPL